MPTEAPSNSTPVPPRLEAPDAPGPAARALEAMRLGVVPDEGVEALRSAVPERVMTELEPFGREEYGDLVDRVLDFYRLATDLDPTLCRRLADPLTKIVHGLVSVDRIRNPRSAMKFLVRFLDIARLRPDDVPAVVDELRDRFAAPTS